MASARILVVDDDQFVRTLFKDILAEDGYSFSEAADGLEAIERLREERPDVVLLDLYMPKMSGIEALARIREIQPDAKVIVVSSLSSEPLVKQALDAGAAAFIVKPLHPVELSTAVQRLLSNGG